MRQRIAHVDDDPDIRDTVHHILSAHGYEVDSYQTAKDFIDSLSNPSIVPDLAILDVMVESMDAGLTTYVELHNRFPRMQAIFLTSLGDMILPYFENKSEKWIWIIEKPIEPSGLLSIVHDRLS
ncbi:response regulator [Nitrosomonas sp. Is37]|uniref:response regulator n=1 Tax=Nitrosomonas sp. Is37 TaxID=3080535 RepID=UPI00294B8C5B|nr:response regulator [Nitrosomonas sp. Is37]MDV6345598.1 response regulator [Nitrosomonas sp. Is37]